MAGSSINEPFVLATYTSTLRGTVLDKPLIGAYASVYQRANKSNEYVTVAAQADAVHVLDVSDLHPVISHTLGPSTYFSCPALTLTSSKSAWTTYAVISSSPELAVEDAGRTVYVWKVDSTSKEKQSKTTKTVFAQGQTVHGLYVCGELQDRIVALSCAGDVTILEAESLDIRSNWPSANGQTVLYAWLLSMALQTTTFMIIIYSGASNTHLRILSIDETDSISQIKDEEIELPVEKIISASCNPTGYLSILTIDGHWFLYNLLEALDASEPISSLSPQNKPLHLTNFSWLAPPSSSRPPATTMSLTSSHVLLATISSHEIILLMWDLQFGVLLASYNLPIPSSLVSSSALHLSLAANQENLCKPPPKTEILPTSLSSGQAFLLVSSIPPGSKGTSGAQKESKVTSIVFVVPYTVPRFSTIAAAIGRGTMSQQWLKTEDSTPGDGTTKHGKRAAEDVAKKQLLLSLHAALQEGRTQAAEAMFLKWTSTITEKEEETAVFSYNFVKELLTAVFTLPSDPRQRPKSAYPSNIVHHILERRGISSAMLTSHGGLLSLLRAHGDWKSIELAFNKVPDLTEMEIVETLMTVLAHHRCRSSTPHGNKSKVPNTMQVDTEMPPSEPQLASDSSTEISNPMRLENYLHLMMNYPTTRGPLLLSFRRHLQDPEDVTSLLQILSDWFIQRNRIGSTTRSLLPGLKDMKKTSEGVWIIVGRRNPKPKQETVPSLEKIISHISILLDSSFLSLLSYTKSHPILRKILSQITPEVALNHAAQDLRGGLEPFAVLHERTLRESLIPKAEKEKEKHKVDWRQRRKGVGAVTGGADIGIYAMEELVL